MLRRHLSFDTPSTSYRYPLVASHLEEERTPVARYDSKACDFSSQNRMFRHPAWLGEISTVGPSVRIMEDERTPVAQHGGIVYQEIPLVSTSRAPEDTHSGLSSSRYECSYCGKGFNRPSSLKMMFAQRNVLASPTNFDDKAVRRGHEHLHDPKNDMTLSLSYLYSIRFTFTAYLVAHFLTYRSVA
ncbi:hypothetical protein C0995_006258 [Termitomyces sp. Mi166|nr:hypothetical protein C0995_006258 [Termitomyces sp. Mi166\